MGWPMRLAERRRSGPVAGGPARRLGDGVVPLAAGRGAAARGTGAPALRPAAAGGQAGFLYGGPRPRRLLPFHGWASCSGPSATRTRGPEWNRRAFAPRGGGRRHAHPCPHLVLGFRSCRSFVDAPVPCSAGTTPLTGPRTGSPTMSVRPRSISVGPARGGARSEGIERMRRGLAPWENAAGGAQYYLPYFRSPWPSMEMPQGWRRRRSASMPPWPTPARGRRPAPGRRCDASEAWCRSRDADEGEGLVPAAPPGRHRVQGRGMGSSGAATAWPARRRERRAAGRTSAPVHDWFVEGFDTPDLRAAGAARRACVAPLLPEPPERPRAAASRRWRASRPPSAAAAAPRRGGAEPVRRPQRGSSRPDLPCVSGTAGAAPGPGRSPASSAQCGPASGGAARRRRSAPARGRAAAVAARSRRNTGP